MELYPRAPPCAAALPAEKPRPDPPPLSQVSRQRFVDFISAHPRALLLYLQQGLARLWRVAHFTLSDFLQLQLHKAHKAPCGGAAARQLLGRFPHAVRGCGA